MWFDDGLTNLTGCGVRDTTRHGSATSIAAFARQDDDERCTQPRGVLAGSERQSRFERARRLASPNSPINPATIADGGDGSGTGIGVASKLA